MKASQPTDHWHNRTIDEVLRTLESEAHGISSSEAKKRLEKFGPNLLPESGPTPIYWIILRQFQSPLIYILVFAALISIAVGDSKDAIFIGVVLGINAAIGAYQESHAEKSSHALKKLLRMHAQVEREGVVYQISADELVPGDLVWIESGNRVAADLRLISTQGMEIDESLLTGESISVSKDADWLGNKETTLAERKNMAFAGSMVARGRAKGIVVATGKSTSVGELALDVLGSVGGKPPLLARMETFTNQVAIGMVTFSIFIGAIGIFFWKYTLIETLFFVIALAVAAIPEGLPIAMTVALAVATNRMASRNVIVRRLTAVEGLGSCTLIATDKTGTLTCNELTVRELRLANGTTYQVTGEGFSPQGQVLLNGVPVRSLSDSLIAEAVRISILCNEAELKLVREEWKGRGDAVDVANLSLGIKVGLHREVLLKEFPLVGAIPFEPEQQYAASFHRVANGGEELIAFVKGAPERILEMCTERNPLARIEHERMALEMAERGLRVIAVADGRGLFPADETRFTKLPENLRFMGYLGMIDPLRPSVQEAIAACHQAGVQVTMVTGDHRITALTIAKDLGLANDLDQVMTASELQGKTDRELEEITRKVRVFARVTPRQKLEIVNAARAAGHFVAVTGDGVNDAPALRAANIGVAMGKSGTDVAREAAELVITDDNFNSIVGGIEEGRIAYDNIRKVIYLLIATGTAELLMVLLAIGSGLPLPLLAVQLLWLNLVTGGIQDIALAFEPGEGNSLRQKPRPPSEPIFDRLMIERVIVAAAIMGLGGFLVYAITLRLGWSLEEARNMLLLTMVLFEIVHIGNCRSETQSAFTRSPLLNPILFYGSLATFLLHVLAMHLPILQSLLEAQPVSPSCWLTAFLVSLTVLPAIEIHKITWRLRFREKMPRSSVCSGLG